MVVSAVSLQLNLLISSSKELTLVSDPLIFGSSDQLLLLIPEVEANVMAKNGFLLQSLWVVVRLKKVMLRIEVAQEMEQTIFRSLVGIINAQIHPKFCYLLDDQGLSRWPVATHDFNWEFRTVEVPTLDSI